MCVKTDTLPPASPCFAVVRSTPERLWVQDVWRFYWNGSELVCISRGPEVIVVGAGWVASGPVELEPEPPADVLADAWQHVETWLR